MDEIQKILSMDIEALSTEPDGVILSIGACVVGTDKTFHTYCHVLPQLRVGRKVSPDTHDWWLKQPHQAFTLELDTGLPRDYLSDTLIKLHAFIADETNGKFLVYTKGHMDFNMLEHAFLQYDLSIPWAHQDKRCLRTLIEDAKIDVENLPLINKNAHDALADALYQAEIIELAREELNL